MNTRTLHLDPNPGEPGGGGAASAAPASGGAAPAAPAFDAGAFESKITGLIQNSLGGFRREVEGRFSKFAPSPTAQPQADKAPSMKDFLGSDGQMDEERFEKFMDARLKHSLKSERSEWEKDFQTKQGQQRSASQVRESQRQHIARETEYEKSNPTYRQDLMNAGDMEVNPQVGARILASKHSANIIHHFAKNRGDFAQFQALSYDDPESALEMLGELSYQFKASAEPRKLPQGGPTRAAFGGGGGGAKPKRSLQEIQQDWA